MNLSKGNRIITVTIMVVLFFLMAVCILAGAVLQQMSLDVASANPDLVSMRIPVLAMGLGLIALFVANLVLAEILLSRILGGRIFQESSARLLKGMSGLFLMGLVPLAALFVYTELNVGGSITQIYVLFGAIVFLTAGLVFRLLANLISNASRFKQEVDWTV
jgi:hypothetical protein